MLQYLVRIDNIKLILIEIGLVDVVNEKLEVRRSRFFEALRPFVAQTVGDIDAKYRPGLAYRVGEANRNRAWTTSEIEHRHPGL